MAHDADCELRADLIRTDAVPEGLPFDHDGESLAAGGYGI